jgi:hypothetical protein
MTRNPSNNKKKTIVRELVKINDESVFIFNQSKDVMFSVAELCLCIAYVDIEIYDISKCMLKTVAIGFLSVNKKNATGCGLPTCHPEARLAEKIYMFYRRAVPA